MPRAGVSQRFVRRRLADPKPREGLERCWRCGVTWTTYGVCCDACEPALMQEYDRERARRGVRWLYLPDDRGARGAAGALAGDTDAARQRKAPADVDAGAARGGVAAAPVARRLRRDGEGERVAVHHRDWWADDPVGCGMSAYET